MANGRLHFGEVSSDLSKSVRFEIQFLQHRRRERIRQVALMREVCITKKKIGLVKQHLVNVLSRRRRILVVVQVEKCIDVEKTDQLLQVFVATILTVVEIMRAAEYYGHHVTLQ